MSKTVLIPLAEGFEEIEAVTLLDVLRRAGLEVILAGVGSKDVTGSHGLKVQADTTVEDVSELPDAVVLPGGMPGSANLKKSDALNKLLLKMHEKKRMIGAICAAPAVVLTPQGILDGKKATCYPGYEKEFTDKVSFSQEAVVEDGHILTSRGPGSAFQFALELVKKLKSPEVAQKLAQGMLVSS